ncbi:MAG: hypothetical protein KF850_17180 [Labilithrix sp.]|nr:hypothetical protein [Labilithrix sp.]
MDVVNLASEFPNDNPALHRGVIWVCLEPTGYARPERVFAPSEPAPALEPVVASEPAVAPEPVVALEPAVAPEPVVALEPVAASEPSPAGVALAVVGAATTEPVAADAERDLCVPPHDSLAPPEDDQEDEAAAAILVEELEPVEMSVEGAEGASDVPAPAVSEIVLAAPRVEVDVARDLVALADDVGVSNAVDVTPRFDEIVATEAPALDASALPPALDSSALPPALDSSALPPALDSSALPPAPDDPFIVLVCTLADVAIAAGSPHVASLLPGLLYDGRLPEPLDAEAADALRAAGVLEGSSVAPAFIAVTSAWSAILRGTSDDFDACGASMLDEWAADLLARMLAAPARAQSLRQELRTRGVAAFGLAA